MRQSCVLYAFVCAPIDFTVLTYMMTNRVISEACRMSTQTGKRTANLKMTLSKRSVEALVPADKPFIAWDYGLTGFGVRVQPSGSA